jgi:hypothetical protein
VAIIATIALAALAAACDFGTPTWEPSFGSGAPIHLVGQNVGPTQPLAPGAPIELFFDRLLLPSTVTRQSFVLTDLNGNSYDVTSIVYDPVARSVTLRTMLAPLPACQNFRVYLLTPAEGQGVGGLQSIDGATLDPKTPPFLEFAVSGTCATGGGGGGDGGAEGGAGDAGVEAGTDAGAGASEAGSDAGSDLFPTIDFCATVLPIFRSSCSNEACHGGSTPAAGLRLDTSQGVIDTAINRVSIESNQGSRSAAQPPSALFGLDMPIVDSTGSQGNPANSWLVYKLMLATPPSSTPAVDFHTQPWSDLSTTERATLGNYVTGSEMPFPWMPGSASGTVLGPLSLDQIEQISFWIQQGAAVPPCAP